MSKCKAVLDGEKITEIRVRTKKPILGQEKSSFSPPVVVPAKEKVAEKSG